VSGYWLDMGTPQKYLQLNCDLLMSKTKSALIGSLGWDDVHVEESTVIHPTAEIVGPAIIGSRCTIARRAHIKGPVAIGHDCYVAEGASIDRTVLWNGVNIGSNANLKQCIVGDNAAIIDNSWLTDRTVID
ncbi:MAG: NDP-sugar synthase, partial [Dehalococcoidales bacterium]|nr:NDP-sugar synthase [Dehalococcoidales bacterium]